MRTLGGKCVRILHDQYKEMASTPMNHPNKGSVTVLEAAVGALPRRKEQPMVILRNQPFGDRPLFQMRPNSIQAPYGNKATFDY